MSKRANKNPKNKIPKWKQPPKLRSEKVKKFKEKRPKHTRATRDPVWLRLREWFMENRISTLKQCGFSDREIEEYLKTSHIK